ncbi:hypothetical protein [Vescimonas sp.]|uniref:hypothetical protein n=1 Tax=Vescimonas sp. TaxID=2892404 RepID=UPI003F806882
MRQHAGVFAANFSSNLLWQNCFAPKKSAFCAEPRRAAAGILDVCQGGATTGLRETRLLRRVFSCGRRPKAGGAGVCAGSGLLASGGIIASALAGLRIIINRRCYYFFLRLFNDGLLDFDNGGIGNGGNYNVGLLLRNLALKYSINMHIVNETVGVNKAGRDYKLSDYLRVKTLSQEASLIGDISFCA